MGNLKNNPPKKRVEVEKGSRAVGTGDHNIKSASLETVTEIYVDGISNITGNIIIDITILHSFFHCVLAHPECFSGRL